MILSIRPQSLSSHATEPVWWPVTHECPLLSIYSVDIDKLKASIQSESECLCVRVCLSFSSLIYMHSCAGIKGISPENPWMAFHLRPMLLCTSLYLFKKLLTIEINVGSWWGSALITKLFLRVWWDCCNFTVFLMWLCCLFFNGQFLSQDNRLQLLPTVSAARFWKGFSYSCYL